MNKLNLVPKRLIYQFLIILLITCTTASLSRSAEETKTGLEPEQALSIISAYSWTNTLPRDLIDLQNDVEETTDFETIDKLLPEISEQIDTLDWDVVSLKSNPNLTYHDVISFESKLIKVRRQLDQINEPIRASIQRLESLYKVWLEKEKKVRELIKQMEADPDLAETVPDMNELFVTINTAKDLIEEQIAPNLLTGQAIGESQTRVYILNDAVTDLIADIKRTGAQQTSPPMLSSQFYTLINQQLFLNGWQNIRLFAKYQWDYVKQYPGKIIFYLLITMLLAFLIHFSRNLIQPSAAWYGFAKRPLASSFFLVGSTLTIINEAELKMDLPPDWVTLNTLPLIISLIYLVDTVKKRTWQTSLLKQLLVFLALSLLMTVVDLPQILSYLLVFYLSVVLISYYFFLFIKRLAKPGKQKVTWAVTLWAFFPMSVIIAGIAGFDQFAVTIFGRVLSLIGATLVVWLLGRMTAGLLELLLAYLPLKIVRSNATTIVREIMPVIILAQVVLWLTLVMSILWLHPTLNASFQAITSLQFSMFSVTVTPGSILTIIFIIYLSFLVSRGFTAFLRQEILPRYRVEEGTQISIARLVHYAILTIGFIILLSVLGFGANQITIIGGGAWCGHRFWIAGNRQ